jgi:hypothetical protein
MKALNLFFEMIIYVIGLTGLFFIVETVKAYIGEESSDFFKVQNSRLKDWFIRKRYFIFHNHKMTIKIKTSLPPLRGLPRDKVRNYSKFARRHSRNTKHKAP